MSENTASVNDAPDPDSDEFLENQDTVDKLTPPDTSADEASLDADSISTDPTTSSD